MPLRAIAALLLVLAVGCAVGGDGVPAPPPQAAAPSEDGGAGQPDGAASDEAEDNGEGDSGTVTASPEAEVTATCKAEPQDDPDEKSLQRLVADLEVKNTGNIGVKLRLAAKWPQPEGRGILRWKRVNVRAGETRELTLRIVVGAVEADAIRKAVEDGRECAVSHRVIGAYGAPSEG